MLPTVTVPRPFLAALCFGGGIASLILGSCSLLANVPRLDVCSDPCRTGHLGCPDKDPPDQISPCDDMAPNDCMGARCSCKPRGRMERTCECWRVPQGT